MAVVIRFADNNLKNLAMAIAIILSCLGWLAVAPTTILLYDC